MSLKFTNHDTGEMVTDQMDIAIYLAAIVNDISPVLCPVVFLSFIGTLIDSYVESMGANIDDAIHMVDIIKDTMIMSKKDEM